MKRYIIAIFTVLLLAGCNDLKNAVSNINSAAETAAKATSSDVHSVRATELTFQNETFTVNDLFKTVLKDVFWNYKEVDEVHTLQIKGTWKEPLFSDQAFDDTLKQKLAEDGKVYVVLTIEDGVIQQAKTTIKLVYQKETLVEKSGQQVMDELMQIYITTK